MSRTICHHFVENESRRLYKIPVQRENIIMCTNVFSVGSPQAQCSQFLV